MAHTQVVVVGAGIGGLVAALHLATRGIDVVVCERASAPGGKMRRTSIGAHQIDAGPTVFTMRDVFDMIFAEAGTAFDDRVILRRADILARHAWDADTRLDLFADRAKSKEAIAAFAGHDEARRYDDFCDAARRLYRTLDLPFMRRSRPSLPVLLANAGTVGLQNLLRANPFATLWGKLGQYFHDPRLRQLFARYATYCGSSPFFAPATLMLIAHVEQEGVWLIEGGMYRLAEALERLATERGVTLRYDAHVAKLVVEAGHTRGVVLGSGERIAADAVICNADVAAMTDGLFGEAARAAVPPIKQRERSLSAVTWAMLARPNGFPLSRHNVFFSSDYAAEFADLAAGRVPRDPTVYICAQDRIDDERVAAGHERLLCLVNAPANGDDSPHPADFDRCEQTMLQTLNRCGLTLAGEPTLRRVTKPTDFHAAFPATGGALYGQASHGWRASFQRPGVRSRIPGLYLAGGSVHPGPGVPMAALSGRMAAQQLLADFASTRPSARTVTPGGTSMPSATTAATG